jgi:hypothetical protein
MRYVVPVFVLFSMAGFPREIPPPQVFVKQIERIVPLQPGPFPGAPLAIPAGRPVNTKGEHVVLRNGDVFRGKFLGFDPTRGLRWQHPHINPELVIRPESVASLTLEGKPPAEARRRPGKVVLINGDVLTGDFLRLENGKVMLNTWYAGELTIDVASIKSLQPGYTKDKVLFEGPVLSKNWTNASGLWKFKDQTFTASSSSAMVGRHIDEMPARASIDFEVDWQNHLSLYINFRTDKLNSYSACNGYCLRLAQTYVYLYRYTLVNGRGLSRRLGQRISINLNTANNNARVSIKFNERTGVLALYINGQYITQWKDPAGFPSESKGLLFTSRTTNRIQLSRIRVTDWNGGLPGQAKPAAVNAKEDLILFNNEDSITGKIVSIKEGRIQIRSNSLGNPIVPLEHVDAIHLAQQNTKPVRVPSVRAELIGRDILTFEIKEWNDGKVRVHSPVFGTATLNAAAISTLTFSTRPK